MTTKHTKGPWRTRESRNGIHHIESSSFGIAEVKGHAGDPEIDANAAVLAAAPDLLAALENHAIPFLMSSVEAHDGDLSPDDEPQDDDPEDLIALRAVVQAIRKARGERESA